MRLAILIVLLVCGISSASSQDERQGKHAAQASQSASKARGTPENPTSVKEHKTPAEEDASKKQVEDAAANLQIQRDSLQVSKETYSATLAASIAACVAAIFAICAVCIAAAQMDLFARQLGLMKDSNKTAATSADAAKVSADTAKDALTKLERPWLFVNRVEVVRRNKEFTEPNAWYIRVEFKNFGRTPALVENLYAGVMDKSLKPEKPPYNTLPAMGFPNVIAVDGAEFSRQWGPTFGKTDDGEIIDYFAYGVIVYRSVTGAKHRTGFALDVSSNLPLSTTYQDDNYEFCE